MKPLIGDSTEWACAQVTLAFFYALDMRRYGEVAALMAPDGIWLRQGAELRGPEGVLAALDARPASRTTCHIISNLRVELNNEAKPPSARVCFYLTAYDNDAVQGSPALRLVAIRDCCDELIKTEAGWRISEKRSRRHLPPE
ncbi:nuclear transport factor 2 family protein [Paralcaligenes ginsengisoli]|jgi:hypothetical protein